MDKYRVNENFAWKYPTAVTLVPVDIANPNGQKVSVALGDKTVINERAGNTNRPALKMIAEPATQAQLKYLYEVDKHPAIELNPAAFAEKAVAKQ